MRINVIIEGCDVAVDGLLSLINDSEYIIIIYQLKGVACNANNNLSFCVRLVKVQEEVYLI